VIKLRQLASSASGEPLIVPFHVPRCTFDVKRSTCNLQRSTFNVQPDATLARNNSQVGLLRPSAKL